MPEKISPVQLRLQPKLNLFLQAPACFSDHKEADNLILDGVKLIFSIESIEEFVAVALRSKFKKFFSEFSPAIQAGPAHRPALASAFLTYAPHWNPHFENYLNCYHADHLSNFGLIFGATLNFISQQNKAINHVSKPLEQYGRQSPRVPIE